MPVQAVACRAAAIVSMKSLRWHCRHRRRRSPAGRRCWGHLSSQSTSAQMPSPSAPGGDVSGGSHAAFADGSQLSVDSGAGGGVAIVAGRRAGLSSLVAIQVVANVVVITGAPVADAGACGPPGLLSSIASLRDGVVAVGVPSAVIDPPQGWLSLARRRRYGAG